MTDVDLAIIGSGSGNSIPDDRFDDWSIAIFEKGVYGGTCLNVGCIPTKMYVYAGEVAETIRESARYGIDSHIDDVRWRDIVTRVFGRIDPISLGGQQYREDKCDNISVLHSHVRFAGTTDDGRYRLLTDAGDEVIARRVVIAAGSRSFIPEAIASGSAPFHTNEDVMRLASLPRHLVIVGGGYISAEFAHVFASLGTEVTIIARGDKLLRHLDADISDRFTEIASKRFDVRFEASVTGTKIGDEGAVIVELSDGSSVTADALLVATGRTPNGDGLHLDTIGVSLDDAGRVECDEFGRTAARDVWTLGDVSSPHQLKHVANHEARVIQANLLRDWDADDLEMFDHRFVPAAVFTHPQIASVGLTEAQAREQGLDITVKVQDYGDVAYGWAMEDTTGLCKIVAERGTGRILGAHLIGPQAPTVIQPVIQAMHFGLDATSMAKGQYWIHPAMPEVLENALLGLDI
ncbi:mycothione reductase [Williamsia sp. MIQD14]|uniref:mycothione reductase n=1 Tax=Williamsia sp. MIQD14 TaxID=3425703 RepID=UPI003DA1B2C8